jgi:hypothetical protein
MTGDPAWEAERRRLHDLPCLSCHAPMQMDDAELQAALLTMPEGCYCAECSARLAAAPSFAAWLDSEREREGGHRMTGDPGWEAERRCAGEDSGAPPEPPPIPPGLVTLRTAGARLLAAMHRRAARKPRPAPPPEETP